MSKLILSDAQAAIRDAGARAKNKGEPGSACPYKMSDALGRVHLQAIIEARGLWFEGYNAATTPLTKRFARKGGAACSPKP